MATYDGYIRVSRVGGREGDSFISPDVQRDRIAQWAQMRDVTIGAWHTDLDMSGARSDRPGLLAALERIERRESQGVVVAKLDRLARSLPVAFDAITRIEDAGGQLVAVDDGIDPSTPTGRMARSILLVIAEWYREQIRESWQTARERAIKRGVAITSTVPTGYRRGAHGRLEPDPRWAPVVRDIFQRRAGGEAWVALARVMNDAGVPVRYTGGGRWTGATVSRLVAGRVYLGEIRHGDLVNTRAHDPLVPRALWQAAQAARGVAISRSDVAPALLSGLVRCAGCGYGMHRGTGRGPNHSVAVSYRCRGGGSGGPCPDRGFAAAWQLDALVARAFLHRYEHLSSEAVGDTGELDAALAALAEAEDALRLFRDDPRIIGALGADAFAAGLQERARHVDDARTAAHAARQPLSGMPDPETLRALWDTSAVETRRRLITAGVDCVVVFGRGTVSESRIRLCWAGMGPTDLPARGRRGVGHRPISMDELPPETRITLPQDR